MTRLSVPSSRWTPAGAPVTTTGGRFGLLKFVVDFGCGGTERQFVNLGLALDDDGVDLHFGCMKRWGNFLSSVEQRGIPVREYHISTFRSVRCLRQQWRLARYIATRRIPIVHAYNFYANLFALPAARMAAAPIVIASIRDRGAYLSPRQVVAQRQVCRLADCVLVNATSIKDWLVDQGIKAEQIVVIPNGIDLATLDSTVRETDIRADVGVPPGTRLVGVVGRLSPTKGIEHVIDAAAIFTRRHPDVRVLIVGEALITKNDTIVEDDAYVQSLKDRVRARGLSDRIIFTGYRADVGSVLSQLSVSVQPSLSEGLSNVILESMAARVPVVATRVGGTPEAVVDNVTGFLVPPADPAALASAINRLLDESESGDALGRAGRRRVEEHFSLARMVRTTEELYADLLSRRGLRRPPFAGGQRPGLPESRDIVA